MARVDPGRLLHSLGSALLLLASACGHLSSGGAEAWPSSALLAVGDGPALFLSAEPSAAQIGYVSDEVTLELTGPPTPGRVPVRIDGALRARGYVAADQLSLRVQKRGRIRGTPVYVAPGQRVRLLGPDRTPGRLRVEVVPLLGSRALGRFEGSYPRAGLAAAQPAATEPAAEPGVLYRVPAQLAVALFELPALPGVPAGPQVAELAAQPEPYEVMVVRAVEGWLAVRAGSGPSLIGWTQAALAPSPVHATELPARPPGAAVASTPQLPARLAHEQGELRRVALGAQVVFGAQAIGVFKTPGWARVQHVYPNGFVDVFAAADDGVALRGVVRSQDLSEVSPAGPELGQDVVGGDAGVSGRSTPAATRSPAP